MIRAIIVLGGMVWLLAGKLGAMPLARMPELVLLLGAVGTYVGLFVADLDRKRILAFTELKDRARRAATTALTAPGVVAGMFLVANLGSWWGSPDRMGSSASRLLWPGLTLVVAGFGPATLTCLGVGKIIRFSKRLTTWQS